MVSQISMFCDRPNNMGRKFRTDYCSLCSPDLHPAEYVWLSGVRELADQLRDLARDLAFNVPSPEHLRYVDSKE
jgi:hypothetical protein